MWQAATNASAPQSQADGEFKLAYELGGKNTAAELPSLQYLAFSKVYQAGGDVGLPVDRFKEGWAAVPFVAAGRKAEADAKAAEAAAAAKANKKKKKK